jgi:hypothetical protein
MTAPSNTVRPSSANCFDPTILKSINIKGIILIAIGILALVASSVATGSLYYHLESMSFAILGSGLALSITCFVLAYCFGITTTSRSLYTERPLSDRNFSGTIENTVESETLSCERRQPDPNLKFNRLPCERDGENICYINTGLHIIAHLSEIQKLFDSKHNKLEKRRDETEDSLNKRKIVQEKGNKLIGSILSVEGSELKS